MMRKILALFALLFTVACLPAAVSLVLVGLATMREPRFDVIKRETSPDQLLDAVHVMPRTGATGGITHWVYITAAGGAVGDGASDDRVFVADQAGDAINIAWANNSELIVSGNAARVFKSKGTTIRLASGESRKIAIELHIDDLRRP